MDSERSKHRVCISSCSHFLACCSSDESVRVWNTLSGKLMHQFVPSKQLTTPVSCLQFTHKNLNKNSGGSGCVLVLGTVDGRLVLYDYSEGRVLKETSATSGEVGITALGWVSPNTLAVLAMDNTLAIWNMEKVTSIRKFSVLGHTSLCLLSPTTAAVANQSIEVLQISKGSHATSDNTSASAGTVLHKFTGHASQTTCLESAGKRVQGRQYLISASRNDIFVRIWKLEEGAGDVAIDSSCCVLKAMEQVECVTVGDGFVVVISVTGTLRIFHANYKRFDSQKPLQADGSLTLYSGKKQKSVVPIVKAFSLTKKEVTIAYGVGVCLQFEKIPLSSLRGSVKLVRAPTDVARVTNTKAHELATDVTQSVAHVTPSTMPVLKKGKRKAGEEDPDSKNLPMEELLTAMTGAKAPSDGASQQTPTEELSNVTKKSQSHLLIQGLHSNDRKLLLRVLNISDAGVIERTVASLPITAVVPLINAMKSFLHSHWHKNRSFAMWLREVATFHSSFLRSLPNNAEIMQPFLQYCATMRESRPRVLQLKTRLDLFALQLKKQETATKKPQSKVYTPLVVVSDDSSDDDDDSGVSSSPCTGAHLTNGHASHSDMADDSDLEEDEEMEVSEEDQDESDDENSA